VDSVFHELRDPHDPRADHGQLHGHRLHGDHGYALGEARQAEEVRSRVVLADVVLADGAEEADMLRQPEATRVAFGLVASRPVANDGRGDVEVASSERRDRVEEQRETLPVEQAADEQDLCTICRRRALRRRHVHRRIDATAHNVDVRPPLTSRQPHELAAPEVADGHSEPGVLDLCRQRVLADVVELD